MTITSYVLHGIVYRHLRRVSDPTVGPQVLFYNLGVTNRPTDVWRVKRGKIFSPLTPNPPPSSTLTVGTQNPGRGSGSSTTVGNVYRSYWAPPLQRKGVEPDGWTRTCVPFKHPTFPWSGTQFPGSSLSTPGQTRSLVDTMDPFRETERHGAKVVETGHSCHLVYYCRGTIEPFTTDTKPSVAKTRSGMWVPTWATSPVTLMGAKCPSCSVAPLYRSVLTLNPDPPGLRCPDWCRERVDVDGQGEDPCLRLFVDGTCVRTEGSGRVGLPVRGTVDNRPGVAGGRVTRGKGLGRRTRNLEGPGSPNARPGTGTTTPVPPPGVPDPDPLRGRGRGTPLPPLPPRHPQSDQIFMCLLRSFSFPFPSTLSVELKLQGSELTGERSTGSRSVLNGSTVSPGSSGRFSSHSHPTADVTGGRDREETRRET